MDKVKPNYSIFLVTSKKPPVLAAPDLSDKSLEMCKELLGNIKYEVFYVTSPLPSNTCVSQHPQAGEPIRSKKMTVYISKPDSSLNIFPNCLKEDLVDVIEFLKMYQISPNIRYAEGQPRYAMHQYAVIEQKPLPGSLVDLSKPVAVQLLVKRK